MASTLLRFFWNRWPGRFASSIRRPASLRLESLEDRTVPATLTVTNMTLDSATTAGTLRYALGHANAGDTINITVPGTLNLTAGVLIVSKSVTINGLGASSDLINAQQKNSVFDVTKASVALTMSGLTIERGFAGGEGGPGGGIDAAFGNDSVTLTNCIVTQNTTKRLGGGIYDPNGNVTLVGCMVTGNTGAEGGGIVSNGLSMTNTTVSKNAATNGGGGGTVSYANVSVVDCTISGNTAKSTNGGGGMAVFNTSLNATVKLTNTTIAANQCELGGGLYLGNDVKATIADCTIAGNIAPGLSGNGGGIWAGRTGSSITINNSIVAANTANSALGNSPDIFSAPKNVTINYSLIGNTTGLTIAAGSHNILNANPKLGPLTNNGGPTQTMALLAGSPAINTGNNSLIPSGITTDQRGDARIVGGTVDMGAYELQMTVTTLVSSLNPALVGQNITFTATVSFSSGGKIPPGTLNFYIDGTLVASLTPNSSGQGSFSDSSLAAGTYAILAVFVPSDGSIGSQASLTQVVNSSGGVIGRRRTPGG